GHNILQASSPNTAKRYAATIRLRLNTLDKSAWTLIAECSVRATNRSCWRSRSLPSAINGHNILQASSPNTAKRYAATIRLRLN
ncbi:BrxA family protein, partial [Escherichia sp. TWPC-MK]